MRQSICSMCATMPARSYMVHCVQKATKVLQQTTNLGIANHRIRQTVTLLVACWTFSAFAQPLESAASEAMRLCASVGAASLDDCRAMQPRSAVELQAQRSVTAFFEAYSRKTTNCAMPPVQCELNAKMLVERGFKAALEPVQTRSLPQSDTRR